MTSSQNDMLSQPQRTHDMRMKLLDRELARFSNSPRGLLEILFTANALYGYLPKDILRYISRTLKVPPSRVYSVASSYSALSLNPQTAEGVRVCSGTSCHIAGADHLRKAIDEDHQCEGTPCSGLCHFAPVAWVHDGFIPHATIDEIGTKIKQNSGAAE